MAEHITDGDFSTAQPISDIRFSAPIPGVATQYIAQQDFCIERQSFSPIAIGTAHPTLTDFYLQRETELQPLGKANVMGWTRIYAKVPVTHSLPSSVSYEFIGFYETGSYEAGHEGREPRSRVVPARIQFDYFRLDGVTYTSILDIPVIEEQKYYSPGAGIDTIIRSMFADGYIGYSQAAPVPQLNYNLTANPASAYPTREAYELWIDAETEIVAVASQLSLWNGFGNIIERQTTYIKAR
jgi:hypothetical protein